MKNETFSRWRPIAERKWWWGTRVGDMMTMTRRERTRTKTAALSERRGDIDGKTRLGQRLRQRPVANVVEVNIILLWTHLHWRMGREQRYCTERPRDGGGVYGLATANEDDGGSSDRPLDPKHNVATGYNQ